MNPYLYCVGNPINLVDPMGLIGLTTPDAYMKQCWRHPSAKARCECVCAPIPYDYEKCVDQCMECFPSKKLLEKDLCICTCKAAGYSDKDCKRRCKFIDCIQE